MLKQDYPSGFYGNCVSCKVKYSVGWLDYDIEKIDDIIKEKRYFKNTNHYILYFIEHIKENVIKKCKNLNQVRIELLVYDKDNILHRFIVSVSNFIRCFLKQKQTCCFKKSVFVCVLYESNLVFTGIIDFKGID